MTETSEVAKTENNMSRGNRWAVVSARQEQKGLLRAGYGVLSKC
jgi:hypothetical protein